MARKYELRQRAERQAETRRKIVEAAVDLHTTIGPAATSVSAIAERAGVQRHTVYAHFPDLDSLFQECSAHWRSLHPIPALRGLGFAEALSTLYGWYGEVGEALAVLARDAALYPDIWRRERSAFAAMSEQLARRLGRGKLLRAAVSHALAFDTWRTLTADQGLSTREAVDLMSAFVDAARRGVRSKAWRLPKDARPTRA